MKKTNLLLSIALTAIASLYSCKEGEGKKEDASYKIPSTYNFDNVNYSGQTDRLGMLNEMSIYLKSANISGTSILEARALDMFSNGQAANFTGSYDASKQLKNKTFTSEQAVLETLIREQCQISSTTQKAKKDTAGRIMDLGKTKEYLLNKNGIELAQVIEKGLMGACLYYQSTSVYFGSEKMDVDNETVTPGEGTIMQHHWDEAFGYLGVPKDFPINTAGLFFWGNYINSRNALLGSNKIIMDAFLKGRAAIGAKRLNDRDVAISTIRKEWDKVSATTAIHYLNAAINSFDTDKAVVHHALSEAIAFIYSLKFNEGRKLSIAEIDSYLNTLAGSSDITKMNLYNTSKADLESLKAKMAADYDVTNIADQL